MGVVYLTTNLINGKKYIGVDSKNNKNYFGSGIKIKLAIKKYGKSNFKKEILEQSYDIPYLFEREIYYIEKNDAVNSLSYYNMAAGGKGGAGTLTLEDSKIRHKIGALKGVKKSNELRKGKTYDEIYGKTLAHEQKEKRKLAGLGKIYDETRRLNISNSLKGHIPWNKGLTNIKGGRQSGIKLSTKKYILIDINKNELEFFGRKNIESYIKTTINLNLKLKSKINIGKLIDTGYEKGYEVKINKLNKPIVY